MKTLAQPANSAVRDYSRNYTSSTRRYILDTNLIPFHAMPLDKFDAKKYVNTFASANVNCIFFPCKNHFGYSVNNTKVGIRQSNLQKDLLAEVIKHAHAHGIKVNAYYSLGFDSVIIERHPDWTRRDIHGKPIQWRWYEHLNFGNPCFNSPYRKYALDQMRELAEGYDADLYWIDMLNQHDAGRSVCYCEHCQKAYRGKFGKDIPTEENWDKKWRQHVNWRLDILETFWKEIIETVHKYKPGCPVCKNFSALSCAHRARLVKGEEFVDGDVAGAGDTSCDAPLLRGLVGNKAFHFCINTGIGATQDWVSRYRHKLRAMNHLCQGGISVFGEYESPFHPDGTLEGELFNRLGASFDEVAQKEKYIQDAVSVPYVGIVYSDDTKHFYRGADNPAVRREKEGMQDNGARQYFPETVRGSNSTLYSLHIPFTMFPEWEIDSGTFKAHTIIILPNVAAMSAKRAEALKSHVAEGGLLLGTFETSLYDQECNPLRDFQLADVFGLKYLGQSHRAPGIIHHNPISYITATNHQIFKGLPKGTLRIKGTYIQTKVISGETTAFIRDPAEMMIGGKQFSWGTLPGKETVFPAIHVNRYGRGKAIFVACQIFKDCCNITLPGQGKPLNIWWTRRLIGNLLEVLDANPPFRVEAPDTVEATFWRNPAKKQVIVQLLNLTNEDYLIPVEDIKIQIRAGTSKLKEAYFAWPAKKKLEIRKGDGIVEITVPKIGMHELIILQS